MEVVRGVMCSVCIELVCDVCVCVMWGVVWHLIKRRARPMRGSSASAAFVRGSF